MAVVSLKPPLPVIENIVFDPWRAGISTKVNLNPIRVATELGRRMTAPNCKPAPHLCFTLNIGKDLKKKGKKRSKGINWEKV